MTSFLLMHLGDLAHCNHLINVQLLLQSLLFYVWHCSQRAWFLLSTHLKVHSCFNCPRWIQRALVIVFLGATRKNSRRPLSANFTSPFKLTSKILCFSLIAGTLLNLLSSMGNVTWSLNWRLELVPWYHSPSL